MTSAKIPGFVSPTDTAISLNSGAKGKDAATTGVSFTDVIGQTASNTAKPQFDNATNQKQNVGNTRETVSNVSDGGYARKNQTVVKSDAPADQKMQNLKDKIEDAAQGVEDEISNVLEEKLGVSKEQIEDAMSMLGLSFMDLMNPSDLSTLVAQLTGTENTCELLMNEDFTSIMQSVEELTQTLSQELGISKQELISLCSQMDETVQATEVMPETEKAVQTVKNVNPVMDQEIQEHVSEGDQLSVKQEMSAEQGNAAADAKTVVNPEQTKVTQEEQVTAIEVNQVNEETNEQSLNGETQQNMEQDSEKDVTPHLKEETVTKNVEMNAHLTTEFRVADVALQDEVMAPTPYTSSVDVENIMNQISEFAKLNFTADTTSLEMQLNPENLGKIYLHVSTSKEGNITAQIAASNEVVKEALETQMADLKTSLNQQGIKVDAVEVTIASHEFERNLEQNAKGDANQSEYQEEASRNDTGSNGIRRILRGELDGLSGLMSEEDVLAAKIMKDNGNTMDVTV